MANIIRPGGVVNILASSSTGPGAWYKVEPGVRNPTVQATVSASSSSVAITASINIEVSNDGVNPCNTVAGNIAPNATGVGSDGFALAAHWEYVRANTQSISTGTVTGVYVSAGNHKA